VTDWRNKAIAPYERARDKTSPALPTLRGSRVAKTAIHCPRIVFSMNPRSAAMQFCLAVPGAIDLAYFTSFTPVIFSSVP
jgi:hypothetical protein